MNMNRNTSLTVCSFQPLGTRIPLAPACPASLRLGLMLSFGPIVLPSGFHTKIVFALFFHCVLHSIYPIPTGFVTLTMCGEEYEL